MIWFSFVSSRCQNVQTEAAICAICFAQPHRLYHVVCHFDHKSNKVGVTIIVFGDCGVKNLPH